MKNYLLVLISATVTIILMLLWSPAPAPEPVTPTVVSNAVTVDSVGSAVVTPVVAVTVDTVPIVQNEITVKPSIVGSKKRHKDIYDLYFKKYSERLFGMWFDWRWFKAQGIAESNLNPDAISHCHALGMMQILPSTHADIIKKNSWIENNIWSPRWNIAAGIAYDKEMWDKWSKIQAEQERIQFMFGSYNGGYGNVLKSYLLVVNQNKPPTWYFVALEGRNVQTWRVGETANYVKRIFKVKQEI